MPRPSRSLLTRFSLLDTRSLAAARQATSGFWPKHTSVVLGPEDYALELNRVALGRTALTYVSCTSRIRVMSAEPAADFTLYVPLRGEIEMLIDGEQMTATATRPLLRGPVRSFVFEPSPTRCLVVDIPVAAMKAAASAAGARLPCHASIDAAPAAASTATTVAEVAVQAGFTHLGRFATEYRLRFGELPSQALARRRGGR